MKLEQITTPALLVDLDAMESNLRKDGRFFRGQTRKLRPHFKNHKVPLLAWKQLRAGAMGITCATLREAEILVHHGMDNILIANEIAGDAKAERLAELSKHASVIVAMDSSHSVRDLARAQRNRKSQIEIVVDIDIGMGRCGVQPGEAALNLAKDAVGEGLGFRGLMGYDGHFKECRRARIAMTWFVKGASHWSISGSHRECGNSGLTLSLREAQALMLYLANIRHHRDSGRLISANGHPIRRPRCFFPSLTYRSCNRHQHARREHAVIDCGVKAISGERGLSAVKEMPGVYLKALHAEHGLLEIRTELRLPLSKSARRSNYGCTTAMQR